MLNRIHFGTQRSSSPVTSPKTLPSQGEEDKKEIWPDSFSSTNTPYKGSPKLSSQAEDFALTSDDLEKVSQQLTKTEKS